jgi:hypothetical protein
MPARILEESASGLLREIVDESAPTWRLNLRENQGLGYTAEPNRRKRNRRHQMATALFCDIVETMRSLSLTFFILSSLVVVCPPSGSAQSTLGAVPTAEISADLGTCSALIIVTDADSKPIYSAKVTTRIRFGLLGVKKLDLEADTGADGQLKITNLPEVLKKPMYIYIQKDNKRETVEFRPDLRCRATFNVQLK